MKTPNKFFVSIVCAIYLIGCLSEKLMNKTKYTPSGYITWATSMTTEPSIDKPPTI